MRRARNRAGSKGGEGRFFHRFIFLLLFAVSRSKVTPPIFLLRELSIFKTFDEIFSLLQHVTASLGVPDTVLDRQDSSLAIIV